MPKKLIVNEIYAVAVREHLKAIRAQLGGSKELYRVLYSTEPSDSENQTLINLLNRGNLSAEFLGLCADKLNLHDTTLGELFKLQRQE